MVPCMQTLDVIQKKHVSKILFQLLSGRIRFSDLQNGTGVNTSCLQNRLSLLLKEKFIEHECCETDRRSGYYSLTRRGLKLTKKLTVIASI